MKRVLTFALLIISCLIHEGFAQALFLEKELKGLFGLTNNNGLAVADYDGDGHLDVYVVANRKYDAARPDTWSRLFKNNNDATFTDVTLQSGLDASYDHDIALPWLPYFLIGDLRHGASWGDYDNDGDPDLFLTNYKFNKLYRNDGDGTFTDVTTTAMLNDEAECYSTSAAWLDYNNDGFLDLVISAWALCDDSRLFENNGDGTFSDQSSKIAFPGFGNTWMTLPVNVNDDQWVDLFFVNDFRENVLLVNNEGEFTNETEAYGLTEVGSHMGATYADVNNDGLLDLYVSDINKNELWLHNGSSFTNVAPQLDIDSTEWSWQTRLADLDLDGDQDLLVVNGYAGFYSNFHYRNDSENGQLKFTDVSREDGFSTVTSSMTFETFDYDHDGDLDVLTTGWRRPPTFHENRTITVDGIDEPNWVAFSLEGNISNRSAIGTRMEITTESGKKQVAYYSGVGFMTQSLQPVHFGLGADDKINHVKITWPLGMVEEYTDLLVNKTIAVVEGQGYTVLELQSTKISGCTDPNSCSYNPRATTDDGSCEYLESKPINGTTTSGVYRTETYTYPVEEGHQYIWSVENGHILDGQGTGSVTVQWEISQSGRVSVVEQGVCYSEDVVLEVILDPTSRSEDFSIARLWSEVLLEGIRNDFARPTVHARNLFHASAMMYDLWVLYHDQGSTYLLDENFARIKELTSAISEEERDSGLEIAISHAMYKLMRSRFVTSPDRIATEWLMQQLMDQLGLDTSDTNIDFESGSHAAIGNYVAEAMIEYGYNDGSREQFDYRNSYYTTVNTPLTPDFPGNPICEDPNRWQPLQLVEFIDQSGNLIGESTPQFLSPEWGNVKPFALDPSSKSTYQRDGDVYQVFHDPGSPPLLSTSETSDTDPLYKWGFSLVSIWGAHLDPNDGVMWDISPASIGNISLEELPTDFESHEDFYNTIEGGDIGKGRSINPHTGAAYQPQMVPRGDYARVLAEFWADGPDSETPPGHWYTLLNYVNDHPQFERKFEGNGESLDILEWDVKAYFALGGAMHDAAISAWSVKGWYDYIRPVSAIRFMAHRGQSSDPNAANYHPQGVPLLEDYIEIVKEDDPLAGRELQHVGKIKVYSWRGHDYIVDTDIDKAGVGWILAENWWPYQRPSFVTPPFAGYVSGHSTYSRAAAELLTLLTGDEYFPGGMGEFVAKRNEFLVFEEGPSMDVVLQWATYRDASDQCSLSRIWGGIHPPADDIPGRLIGEQVGVKAFDKARSYFSGTVLSADEELPSTHQLFPNPIRVNGWLTIRPILDKNYAVELFDLGGRSYDLPKQSIILSGRQLKIKMPAYLRRGIYLLKVGEETHKILIMK